MFFPRPTRDATFRTVEPYSINTIPLPFPFPSPHLHSHTHVITIAHRSNYYPTYSIESYSEATLHSIPTQQPTWGEQNITSYGLTRPHAILSHQTDTLLLTITPIHLRAKTPATFPVTYPVFYLTCLLRISQDAQNTPKDPLGDRVLPYISPK